MAKFNKKSESEVKVDPLAEAQKKYDEAKLKSEEVLTSEEFSPEEKAAVKAEVDDAEKLLSAIVELNLEAPAKPSSETRKYFTISCLWAHGRYPKLGLKFTNGIAVVNTEQYELAKESKLWGREIFDGVRNANSGSSVKVVKEQ